MKLKTLLTTALLTLALPALAESPFSAAEQEQMAAYKHEFEAVANQAQLAAVYRQALKLSRQLKASLKKYIDAAYKCNKYPGEAELKALAEQLPGLQPALVAEGTTLALLPDYSSYYHLAAYTPESADDAYFDLMLQAYGPVYYYLGKWYTQTSDYGGCTRLGSGIHTKLFEGIQRLRAANNLFTPELRQLENKLVYDLKHTNHFCLPYTQVVHEYEQVLPLTPPAVRARLQRRLQQIKNKAKDLYFHCDSPESSCNYG